MSTPGASVPDTLTLEDAASLDDLGRYARRARSLDEDAAVRLQAAGSVLAAWVGVLPGSGILGEGLVLGLRTFALAEPATADVIVPVKAITDRTARRTIGGAATLSIPPVHVSPAWASITPPRVGWEYAGVASGDDLADVARSGVAQVSAAVKERGAAAGFTKEQVWGAEVTYSEPRIESGDATGEGREGSPPAGVVLPAGVALAAYALGFLSPGQPVEVYRTNRWTRVTGPGGHVLAR